MARSITLQDLKPREYEFDVEMPDGEMVSFTMRAPSQAQMWAVERGIPIPQRDQFVNRSNPFHKDANGNVVPIIDDQAYIAAQEDRLQQIMYRKILAAWVDAPLEGDTEEERIAEMATLGSWAISALWKMTQALVTTNSDAIAARKFRGD